MLKDIINFTFLFTIMCVVCIIFLLALIYDLKNQALSKKRLGSGTEKFRRFKGELAF